MFNPDDIVVRERQSGNRQAGNVSGGGYGRNGSGAYGQRVEQTRGQYSGNAGQYGNRAQAAGTRRVEAGNTLSPKQAKKQQKKLKKQRRHKKFWFGFKIFMLIALIAILAALVVIYFKFGDDLLKWKMEATDVVENSTADTFRASETSIIYASNKSMIAKLKGDKDSYYLSFDEIPQSVKDAMVVTEDRDFYKHEGVNFWSTAKAAVMLVESKLRHKDISRGGSTITQQLVKNVFLSNERTYERKVREIFIALDLEKKYTKDQILAENDIEFSSVDDMYNEHEELNLGDIMSDAYVYAVENSEYYDGDPVDVAVVPSGTVRDTYTKGDVTVEQVYNSFSLGIGKDGLAGYPLISAYLTGKELKLVAEIDASVSDFMTIARLYCSGLNFTYNPHRMILNKVTDCYLMKAQGEGNREEIEDDKLYHVVTDLYTGQMLGAVMDTSYGLLSITPKDKDGNPIENLEDQAIMEGNQELKAWAAIARYMESFDDTDGDGIANVSKYYNEKHDRKVVEDSWNIIDLVKHPNKFSAIIAGIFVLVLVLIILLILLVRRIVRKIKNN